MKWKKIVEIVLQAILAIIGGIGGGIATTSF